MVRTCHLLPVTNTGIFIYFNSKEMRFCRKVVRFNARYELVTNVDIVEFKNVSLYNQLALIYGDDPRKLHDLINLDPKKWAHQYALPLREHKDRVKYYLECAQEIIRADIFQRRLQSFGNINYVKWLKKRNEFMCSKPWNAVSKNERCSQYLR